MIGKILAFLRGRKSPSELSRSGACAKRLEDDIAGELFGIEYYDNQGNFSLRDITVKAVWRDARGTLKVSAHCHQADQPRTFLVENIRTLVHGRTKGVIRNPTAYLGRYAQDATPELRAENSRTYEAAFQVREYTRRPRFAKPKPLSVPKMRKELRDLVRPTAVLLMAVAHADADGRLCEEEVWLIGDLVWEGARKTYTIYQTEMLMEMVEEMVALQPSANMINRALKTTIERGAFPLNMPEWLIYMARADGPVSEGKRAIMTQMLTTLRRLSAAGTPPHRTPPPA
ncbi:hypothetical protein ACT6QH_02080 [Xanthobacter sp. TB0139]|uniref:hypothetical protein n=1 Tax=Xanthobacter sp. TB0139 TaxID=3459178 RepID=UPI0040399B24